MHSNFIMDLSSFTLFVRSYPPSFVRPYLMRSVTSRTCSLRPFCHSVSSYRPRSVVFINKSFESNQWIREKKEWNMWGKRASIELLVGTKRSPALIGVKAERWAKKLWVAETATGRCRKIVLFFNKLRLAGHFLTINGSQVIILLAKEGWQNTEKNTFFGPPCSRHVLLLNNPNSRDPLNQQILDNYPSPLSPFSPPPVSPSPVSFYYYSPGITQKWDKNLVDLIRRTFS